MRTAICAGLVAGAVVLPGAALGSEGSSLRGLRAPMGLWEQLLPEPLRVREGLKHPSPATAFDLAPRTAFYAGALEARNVQLSDADLKFGLYRPLGAGAMLGQGSVDPIFDVIPKYTLYSQVTQSLGAGFGVGVGLRRSEYNLVGSNLLALSAEQIFGSFRGAYTLYSNRGDALGGSSAAHRFQLSYAYGDRNTVGLAYTTGRDIDNFNVPLGMPAGLSVGDVRDWSVSGRHWLSTNWALTYDVQTQESALAYRRQGLRLGVSRSF